MWRFRKVFGRGPFRWTLSKRGIGWSWGIPGLRYGVSPSGQRYISLSITGDRVVLDQVPETKAGVITSSCCASTRTPPSAAPSNPIPPSAAPTRKVPWWKQKGL